MKNKKLPAFLLSLTMCLSLMSCSKNNEQVEEVTSNENVLKIETNEELTTSIMSTLASKIMEAIMKKGEDTIKSKAFKWGKKACYSILNACGIPISDTSATDLILEKLEEMQQSLKSIENTLNKAVSKIDQNESTRILDNFMTNFNELKVSVDPVMSGLATFVDRERAIEDNDEAKLNALLKEEVEFYKTYVSTLKKSGNSFSERVINLANLITKPSTNSEYTLLRCFDLTVMDNSSLYEWNSQRFEPKYQYLTYLGSFLLNTLSIARFEIAYKLNEDISVGGQALWNKTSEDLDEAVSEALKTLQNHYNATKKEEDDMKSGNLIYHVKTNIKVASKMAILSLNDNTNVLSYRRNYYSTYDRGVRFKDSYARLLLNTNKDLLSTLTSSYNNYLTAANLNTSNYNFYTFLHSLGFYTLNNDSATAGLYVKTFREHEGWAMTNEYYKYKVNYIDRSGSSTETKFGQIVDKVWRHAYYETYASLNNKYLVLLEPNAEKVYGSYEQADFGATGRGFTQAGREDESFPYRFDYDEAKANNTLGKVDKSW